MLDLSASAKGHCCYTAKEHSLSRSQNCWGSENLEEDGVEEKLNLEDDVVFTPLLLIRFWKGNFFGDPCALFSLDTLCVLEIVVINDFFALINKKP